MGNLNIGGTVDEPVITGHVPVAEPLTTQQRSAALVPAEAVEVADAEPAREVETHHYDQLHVNVIGPLITDLLAADDDAAPALRDQLQQRLTSWAKDRGGSTVAITLDTGVDPELVTLFRERTGQLTSVRIAD